MILGIDMGWNGTLHGHGMSCGRGLVRSSDRVIEFHYYWKRTGKNVVRDQEQS